MTDAAKPTVGVWETIKNGCGEVGVRANGHWITFNAGDRLPVDEAESNAALIAEAGTVYQETGLTPRQLAEQRDELLKALKYARRFVDVRDVDTTYISTIIAKVETKP